MLSLFGTLSLYIAFGFALLQTLLPFIGYYRHSPYLLALTRPLTIAQFVFIFFAYVLLTLAFVNNDFSIAYVAANSHPDLPFIYRVTALWGAHEGSILLWIFILNLWTMVMVYTQKQTVLPIIISVLGLVSGSFLGFLLWTSNPFLRALVKLVPQDLNPLLQDPGFVIHPPMLYMGYVGLAAAFAITEAHLIAGKLDVNWARSTRYFALLAWCFLTLGITLGSWWAYRVLGWGGFWFWDPVENASLLPWLASTALIHVLLLVETRTAAKKWAVFLAIICFVLSLLGTFLVRSGLLVSSHTFANDPARGIFLLMILTILITLFLVIYFIRLPAIQSASLRHFPWLSREIFLLFNSGLLFVAMLTILLGTLYPLILDALHLGSISVGAPYFNQVMSPFVLLIFILMALMTLMPKSLWKNKGMLVAHAGFIILILGIFLSSWFAQEKMVRLRPGLSAKIGPYQFFFLETKGFDGPNYRAVRGYFDVLKADHHVTYLMPEKRIYFVRDMVMTKVDIHPGLFRDLYIALGEPLNNQEWSVRIYYKPFIRWVWIGGLFMILGGVLVFLKRGKA
jgi:cytochrome c-type biogenesis protein CcmF